MKLKQLIAAALIACSAACFASAQPSKPSSLQPAKATEPTRESLEAAWQAAYEEHDYEAAADGLAELVRFAPGDPIVRYNLACVQTLRGDIDGAERALRKCIELGFTDFPRMLAEKDLQPLAEGVVFAAIREGWRELQDTGIDYRLQQFQRTLKVNNQTAEQRGYQIEKNAPLRLAFVSGFSKEGHAETKVELQRITDYWRSHVLPPDATAVVADGQHPDPWVLVFLPNAVDFQSWASATLGARADRVGGLYDNWKQQLVARDLGPTLRHEFWHALHWRHMSRVGQVHAMWVQEGLCSLIEDVDLVVEQDESVRLVPVASWRTNTARRMAKINLLPKLSVLMTMDEKTYMGSRALGHYAASRAFFLWLVQGGAGGIDGGAKMKPGKAVALPSRLRDWYAAYTADFAADPTGKTTTERVLGKPLAALDRDFKAWLLALPDVGEQNTPGLPTLPCDMQPVGGEGMVVIGTGTNDLLRNPLIAGDVIVSVDGHAVRDQTELARLLGTPAFKPGQQVLLKVRRDGRPFEVKVRLGQYE